MIKKKFKILKKDDPIYLLKSLKNKTEIKNILKSHVFDGVALTKFIYWIKNINKKKITEFEAQNKLENFRKKIKSIYIQVLLLLLVPGGMAQLFIIEQQK